VAAAVYGDPSRRLSLLGVTGTNGKTTTAYLIEAGLRGAGLATGLLGTVETRIGDDVLPSVRTTPEAPELQALLAVMVERGADAVAMEVSSHALELGRVDGAKFAAAVFTNLSQDHLDFHPSLEDYFLAKARLFAPAHAGVAVINLDDEYGQRLVHRTRLPSTTYSAAGLGTADWRADRVETSRTGTSFVLLGPSGEHLPVRLRMPGAFNVANALGALAALTSTGLDLAAAVAGLAALSGVPGRMEPIDAGQPFLALVDYAHTPGALDSLLAAVRPLGSGQVIVVIGCGRGRADRRQPQVGELRGDPRGSRARGPYRRW
jgi:UDP-N-acetylmuramoyl-L-alanyl-D-glutamate--2,6-diaminopimelate ligase